MKTTNMASPKNPVEFDWNVYAQNGNIAYCGSVFADTIEKAMIRAWIEIERSEWYKIGHGHVQDNPGGEWCVDWECVKV